MAGVAGAYSASRQRAQAAALLRAALDDTDGSEVAFELVTRFTVLIDQAFELRETGYAVDAARAIADWFDRLPALIEELRAAAAAERRRRLFEAIDEAAAA
jgi:hypothetical protein